MSKHQLVAFPHPIPSEPRVERTSVPYKSGSPSSITYICKSLGCDLTLHLHQFLKSWLRPRITPTALKTEAALRVPPGIPQPAPEIPRILRFNDAKPPVPPDHLARRSRDNCPHAHRGASYACMKLRGAALCVFPPGCPPAARALS